jgi:phosphopantothenoylcysteine synthetase/decarboxylase
MKLNSEMRKISKARRGYMLSPILVEIYRKGFLYYLVEVSRGPTILSTGEDHELTTLWKAREAAWKLVEKFKHDTANNRIKWVEF